MSNRFTDLHCKEVICIHDGRRLGYVSDAVIGLPDGQITAIIVPGPCRIFGLVGRRDDFVIPFHCINRIGPDIILVDIKPEQYRVPRTRGVFRL